MGDSLGKVKVVQLSRKHIKGISGGGAAGHARIICITLLHSGWLSFFPAGCLCLAPDIDSSATLQLTVRAIPPRSSQATESVAKSDQR